MASPLAAEAAPAALASLCGDLWLYDCILKARGFDPKADVRPLVAMQLDAAANWTSEDPPNGPFEPGVRERLAELADRFRDAPLDPLVRHTYLRPTTQSAQDAAAEYAGDEDNVTPDRFSTFQAGAPGVYATLDTETGEIYRTEIVTAETVPCPEPLRDAMAALYWGGQPKPG
jgi:hypothetical protein